jgi:hypothetical protein
MEYRNFTPFPSLAYEGLDQLEQEFHVAVLRMTLEMCPDNSLDFAKEQMQLVTVDEYFGEMNKSSVKQENDLVPFKPKCDVILNGTAYAPEGKLVSSFKVGIRITHPSETNPGTGQAILEKTLTVTGPRFWKENGNSWHLTEPEPISSLPLRFEYAYGGECRINLDDPSAKSLDSKRLLTPEQRELHPDGPGNAPAAHTVCESNPIGIGFMEPWYLDATKSISPQSSPSPPPPQEPQTPPKGGFFNKMSRLFGSSPLTIPARKVSLPVAEPRKIPTPQIESPDDPVREFGKHYIPQGFGVITKSWLPRRQLCGTIDEDFAQSEEWLPDDFDFAYWNGAHPDMQIPYLKGNETIELTNLMPPGASSGIQNLEGKSVVRFVMPGHKPYLLARFEEGEMLPIEFKIDTLIIDTENRNLSLVYRAVLPKEPEVRVLEVRIMKKAEAELHDSVMKEIENEPGREDWPESGGDNV